jgi:hypothetical protein
MRHLIWNVDPVIFILGPTVSVGGSTGNFFNSEILAADRRLLSLRSQDDLRQIFEL